MTAQVAGRRDRVEVFASANALMQAAAERFVRSAADAIAKSGRFAVALSGGSTPRGLYARLATEPLAARVDWARVHVFWCDERCVPPDDPASNYRMARESLLDHVAVSAANICRIHGEDDPPQAAAAYERELRLEFATPEGPPRRTRGGRFDLVLLGMGADGHTASLFPGMPAIRETQQWVRAHEVAGVPAWRVTLTPLVINAAAVVAFVVSGANKARMLERVIEDPYRPDVLPAQAVRPHDGSLHWLVDAAAATNLHGS